MATLTKSRRKTRRAALMAAAGGSVAALLAGRSGSEAGAASGLELATTNTAGATTRLTAANVFTDSYVLIVSSSNHEDCTAVLGTALQAGGTGVSGSGGDRGVAGAGHTGVWGDGMIGVKGIGGPANAIGVHGLATDPSGVAVRGENSVGLALEALGDTRLDGTATVRGVLRLQDPGSGNSVEVLGKTGPAGVALRVNGPVSFKTSGTARFTKGQVSRAVSGVATPPGARIFVSLNQNPGRGNALKYVKRTSDNGFTAYLVKPVTGVVEFSWFVMV